MRALLFIAICCLTTPAVGGEVHVAVASNFRPAMPRINEFFAQQTGHTVTLSAASTGTLVSQISHGAPYDILLAADDSPTHLFAKGLGAAARPPFCYALGQLVLVGGTGQLTDIGDNNLSMAIANPTVAPYGRAAQEVLERAQFQDARDRKLVRATSVAQAYQYWLTGSVALALVARSLAPKSALTVPTEWYAPITQYAMLLQRGQNNAAAQQYIDLLGNSAAVQELILAAGYGACE